MKTLPVFAVPCFDDNYAWCIATGGDEAAVVDPGQAAPVRRWLEARGLRLRWILLTHHHGDHIGGTEALRHGAEVLGAAADRHRLPALDRALDHGDTSDLGTHRVRVMAVPGHTHGHIAYVVGDVLFSGDALFAYGCGRVFEGRPPQMWASLDRLRQLPATTRLCCGHEYTAANLRFARHLLPHDPGLAEAEARCSAQRQRGEPTLPASMGEQRTLNPFLRCDEPEMLAALGLEGRGPAEVFAEIRGRKDRFRG